MKFEARALRVQLPCKTITVMEADEYDAQQQAHQYWRLIAAGIGTGLNLGRDRCEECSGNPSEPLCENASEEVNLFAMIDARVLPVLRRQLEARLREITEAEDAVAKATGGG